MRRYKIVFVALFFLMSTVFLSGCSQSSQVENQAFVLVMGLDRTQDGQLELCVQLPRISGGSSPGGEGGSDGASDNYIQLSVTGNNFDSALERLRWASPRSLDLAQMKLVVISRSLAEEAGFREVIRQIAQTERLFTAARVTVCEGSARDFVEAIEPIIGTRLSTDINAMFEHFIELGYIPKARLAELFYQTESFYSDPMVSYSMLAESAQPDESSKDEATPAAALAGYANTFSENYESDVPNRYLGAAVFSGGQLCGTLTGQQTLFANLLRNELNTFHYEFDGQTLSMSPVSAFSLNVDTRTNPVRLKVSGQLSIAAHDRVTEADVLLENLKSDIQSTITAAQEMRADPFGFAERAAAKFTVLGDWIAFDWREKFSQAEVEINLTIAKSST